MSSSAGEERIEQSGVILYGANNIFTVLSGEHRVLCRIKGKVLRQDETAYNPLAPGDEVSFVLDAGDSTRGLITERAERLNAFVRWNRKREAPQTVAANVDLVVCVASIASPPFRPRFIDRLLVAARGIPALVLINKNDLDSKAWEQERIANYQKIGYRVHRCSAVTGEGIEDLRKLVSDKRSVFVGQSGAGKSSLLNHVIPVGNLETGEISPKYDRGRHVTKNARLFITEEGEFIDTPGIRQIEVYGVDSEVLAHEFPEFADYEGQCAFQPCSHREEPECMVKEAVKRGEILEDRYESYLRIRNELEQRKYERYG